MKNPVLLPVRVYGDDILRKKITPVHEIDNAFIGFIENLLHTMYVRDGVGLAANQVGEDKRVFVIDTEWSKEDGKPSPVVLINPTIVSGEGEIEFEEGCLSVPGIYSKVKRFNKIVYSYTDLEGKLHTEKAEDYKAVVIQHENDHLNGVLFIDHLSKFNLLKIKRKLKIIESTAVDGTNIRNEVYTGEK